MAPMALELNSYPQKRTSSFAQFDDPAAKKVNRGHIRHHKAVWDLQKEQRQNAFIQDDEAVQTMLTRSISLALEAVGFGAATPQAMDSFRGDVEECMIPPMRNPWSVEMLLICFRHGALSYRCAAVHALVPSYTTRTARFLASTSHTSTKSTDPSAPSPPSCTHQTKSVSSTNRASARA